MDRSELFNRFSGLVLRHERMIRALCLRHTDRDEEMKDMAQEVRLALWERFAAVDGSLGAWPEGLWVFWHTRAVTSRHRRHQRRELVRLDMEMVESIVDEDDGAMALLDDLAEGLPEAYADLLEQLRQGYSLGEIATRNGEPLATVKSRRRRLVALLRQRAEALGKIVDNSNTQSL